MKQLIAYFILIIFITSCIHHNDKIVQKQKHNSIFINNTDTSFYYSDTSKWASILRHTPLEIRKSILENIRDTNYEFIAQMFICCANVFPQINNLTTICFNIKDEFLLYNLTSANFQYKNKTLHPLKLERFFLIDHKNFNPIDTVFDRINLCNFWSLASEINENGFDGEYYCIIIKYREKLHYVLRWSPDKYIDNKLFFKRKEFVKFIHLFDRLGFYGYYHNNL